MSLDTRLGESTRLRSHHQAFGELVGEAQRAFDTGHPARSAAFAQAAGRWFKAIIADSQRFTGCDVGSPRHSDFRV